MFVYSWGVTLVAAVYKSFTSKSTFYAN